MSLEGFWGQARLLEKKLKEEFPEQKTHGLINNIKKQTTDLYKEENKEGGIINEMTRVDKEQWRRQKYLDLLVENLGTENVIEWVNELKLKDFDFDSPEKYFSENDEGAETVIEQSPSYEDLAVSMEFLKAYDFDFTNVPLIDGKFSAFDQNRFDQLMYKHTGSMEALGNLVRPAFMQ